jgi:hypothetical protein
MTPRISLITAVAAAALALGVPAAWGDDWYADRQQESIRVSPDLMDRAVAAEQHRLATMLDARERSFGAKVDSSTPMLDARERGLVEKREVQLSSGVSPDAFERAVEAQSQTRSPVVADFDRFRIDPSANPVQVTATASGSGREIEWPQIGIGFGVGIALILGLLLALRPTRTRPLAH